MGKIAFLMAGQGSQYPGMVKDLYDSIDSIRSLFDKAELIRPGTKKMCFEGSKEELGETINTQPCMYLADIACAMAAMEKGIEPDYVAGFSLGEVAALPIAGVVDVIDGFSFVMKRAEYMEEAAKANPGGMVAVLTADKDRLFDLCMEAGVYPVNYNCPNQIVVAGSKDRIPRFTETLASEGMRCIPLNVSGAFHTPYMQSASERLRDVLETIRISKGAKPLYSNVTADLYTDSHDEIVMNLVNQVMSPVRWESIIKDMYAKGVDTFVECGPGKVLSGLVKKTLSDVRIFSIKDYESLIVVSDELAG